MKNTTNKEKFILIWIFFKSWLIVASIIVLLGIFRVLISEQSPDGKSASYVACYEYEGCEIIKQSLGKRLVEEIKIFAVVGGILGLMVGGGLVERRKIEQRKLKEKEEYEKYLEELEKNKPVANAKSDVYDQDEYYGK